MNILIENAHIWTNDGELGLIENGFVLLQDNLIAQVGRMEELPQNLAERAQIIAGHGQLLLPGLVCAHTHLYSALARGMALSGVNPQSFRDILAQIWWRLDKALDKESIYYSALIGGLELIRNGVTTVIDHHASPNAIRGSLAEIEKALVSELGLRSCLCYEISDRDGPERAKAGIAENIEFFDSTAYDELTRGLIGLHASFTLSDRTFAQLRQALGGREVGFHIHLAEGPEDQEDSLAKYGKRVTVRLRDLGILGPKTILAHGIHLDEQEQELIAQADAILVHNPQSNMNNAVGIADIPAMLRKGILVGLGNDGFGYEMLSDLRAMFLVHKLVQGDPKAMSLAQAYQIFFQNNYEIVRRLFGVKLGSITPGYPADLILVDYKIPTPLDAANFMGHLLFGLAGNLEVRTTIVNGRILMREREMQGIDEQQAYQAAREAARRLWGRIK